MRWSFACLKLLSIHGQRRAGSKFKFNFKRALSSTFELRKTKSKKKDKCIWFALPSSPVYHMPEAKPDAFGNKAIKHTVP